MTALLSKRRGRREARDKQPFQRNITWGAWRMNQELRGKLNRIIDDLEIGGPADPVANIEQVSYLIFLKILDEEAANRDLKTDSSVEKINDKGLALFPRQAERYRWAMWRSRRGVDLRDFVRGHVFPYMGSLVREEPLIAEYFRDSVLEISDPDALERLVDEIDGIYFAGLGVDVKGELFEYLLSRPGKWTLDGRFRTPPHIRAIMVEMVEPDIGDTIYDPACGTGGFLTDAVDYILARYSTEPGQTPIVGDGWLEKIDQALEETTLEALGMQNSRKGADDKIADWSLLERSVYGIDVSRRMTRIAIMNLMLHGIRRPAIKRAEALSDQGGLSEDDLNRRCSVVLSNPPFGGVVSGASMRKDLPVETGWSEALFLGVMMKALAPAGRCAVVAPERLLSGSSKANKELRGKLVEDYDLLAVVSLPAGAFKPYTGIKTSVLVFRRPGSRRLFITNRRPKVSFFEPRTNGFHTSAISGKERGKAPGRNDIPEVLRLWKIYKNSKCKAPPGVETGTILSPGSEPPLCWWATVETIADNDYNLSPDLYKPRVAEPTPTDDPSDLVLEVMALENGITKGLKRLMRELEALK